MPGNQDLVIDASPTKDFFISMLTRDIPLLRAIIDLVDNSVDGARRLRGVPESRTTYKGLEVQLQCDDTHFKIIDNCGGMSIEVAAKHAFRIGRPEDAERTPHSVGQFGVGMKRALFKIGKKFSIESKTTNSKFLVEYSKLKNVEYSILNNEC